MNVTIISIVMYAASTQHQDHMELPDIPGTLVDVVEVVQERPLLCIHASLQSKHVSKQIAFNLCIAVGGT